MPAREHEGEEGEGSEDEELEPVWARFNNSNDSFVHQELLGYVRS